MANVAVRMKHTGDDEFAFWILDQCGRVRYREPFTLNYLCTQSGVQIRSDMKCYRTVFQIIEKLEALLEEHKAAVNFPTTPDGEFQIEIF